MTTNNIFTLITLPWHKLGTNITVWYSVLTTCSDEGQKEVDQAPT